MAKDFIDVIVARGKKPRGGDAPAKEEADGETAPDESEESGEDGYDKVEGDAGGKLAELLGVEDDDREEFTSALSDYVEACIKKLQD